MRALNTISMRRQNEENTRKNNEPISLLFAQNGSSDKERKWERDNALW